MNFIVKVSILLQVVRTVNGHGYLANPISRNAIQVLENNLCTYNTLDTSKPPCGGDAQSWNVVEPQTGCGIKQGNSAPYVYGNGDLSYGKWGFKTTYTTGQEIQTTVKITAFHGGIFQFRIQNIGSAIDPVGSLWDTAQLLTVNSFSPTCGSACASFVEPCILAKTCAQIPLTAPAITNAGLYSINLQLPTGLVCDHCVIQWRYYTANSCPTPGLSCGSASENFWNCADIAIVQTAVNTPSAVPVTTVVAVSAAPVTTPVVQPTAPVISTPNPNSYFCGTTYQASLTCGKACPLTTECGTGEMCYANVPCTITTPVNQPSTPPLNTPNPNSYFCGTTYQASLTCGKACPLTTECGAGEMCYANVPCATSPVPVVTPTKVPTATVIVPTKIPTKVPTATVIVPTKIPTKVPTATVIVPTKIPTKVPTATVIVPTKIPTKVPTALLAAPTKVPTAASVAPTKVLTKTPSNSPVVAPTAVFPPTKGPASSSSSPVSTTPNPNSYFCGTTYQASLSCGKACPLTTECGAGEMCYANVPCSTNPVPVTSPTKVPSSALGAPTKVPTASTAPVVLPPTTPISNPPGFIAGSYKDVGTNLNWNTNVVSTTVTGSLTPLTTVLNGIKSDVVTFAFATGECGAENWAGVSRSAFQSANMQLFATANIKYIISTGGASGSFTCGTSGALNTFIQYYYTTSMIGIDFDIEAGQTQVQIQNLVQRVKEAQLVYPTLRYSFTIATLAPNNPTISQLSSVGDVIMKAIVAAGLQNYIINLMTMDYGSTSNCIVGINGQCDMGQSAIQAAKNLHGFYNVPYSQIEITPMIGGNDSVGEVFTLDDVRTLVTWAKANGLAGLHWWSLDRDMDCQGPYASSTCNSYGSYGGSAGVLGFNKAFLV